MHMIDFIIAAVILLCVGLAARYIYKSKKAGAKCVGCPHCQSCGSTSTHSCKSK